MIFKEAIEVILDLAIQNCITSEDVDCVALANGNNPLEKEYIDQQDAIEIVTRELKHNATRLYKYEKRTE